MNKFLRINRTIPSSPNQFWGKNVFFSGIFYTTYRKLSRCGLVVGRLGASDRVLKFGLARFYAHIIISVIWFCVCYDQNYWKPKTVMMQYQIQHAILSLGFYILSQLNQHWHSTYRTSSRLTELLFYCCLTETVLVWMADQSGLIK